MPRTSWIIIILITILLVSSYFFSRNREAPDWVKCKESLFAQVVMKQCTPSSFVNPNNMENMETNENNVEDGLPFEPPQN